MSLSARPTAAFVHEVWERDVVPTLSDFIAIPNLSCAFDPAWERNGHVRRAVELVSGWLAARPVAGATVTVAEIPGRTPVVVVDVPAFPAAPEPGAGSGAGEPAVLLYGHLDKQPPFTGWREGLDAFTPVREGDHLYGRGAADDGYAAFAALCAIEAVERGGGAHRRCVVLIEASEESGSPDLPAHLARLGGRLAGVDLVVTLDSWCWSYDTLWVTTSLRGLVNVELTVDVLTEGVHSGMAGGVVPSSFRVARRLLDRIEDAADGRILLAALHADVPPGRRDEIADVAAALGDISGVYPFAGSTRALRADTTERLVARTWEPSLEVISAEGFPGVRDGGNVLRPSSTLGLSIRLPPTVEAAEASKALTQALSEDPPDGAEVSVTAACCESGWEAPATAPWLAAALDGASTAAFGSAPRFVGEGGTIPFMGLLGHTLPDAQFVITGVLGPGSNAHGPNEFLHLPTAEKVTVAVAHLLDAHARK